MQTMKKNRTDIIKRTIITTVCAAFLAYMIYLFSNNQIIVQGEYTNLNMLFYVILILIVFYKMMFFGIKPKAIFGMKMTKATTFVLWITLILLGNYVLLNNVESKVYIWDIVTVLWVIMTILAPTNILITKKIKKQKQNSKMEIIEA